MILCITLQVCHLYVACCLLQAEVPPILGDVEQTFASALVTCALLVSNARSVAAVVEGAP
jgi:hypothetical protein